MQDAEQCAGGYELHKVGCGIAGVALNDQPITTILFN
jgi:hypothetical protein